MHLAYTTMKHPPECPDISLTIAFLFLVCAALLVIPVALGMLVWGDDE